MSADVAGVGRSSGPDVAIIGAGIVGCSAAAFLARAGASVTVYDRDGIGAGASGRNQGVVQHPFDPVLALLHPESVTLLRELADAHEVGFSLPDEPAGLLMIGTDEAEAAAVAALLRSTMGALAPEMVSPTELARLEPALADGLAACRLSTGYPIPPASATEAYAELARRHGARFRRAEAAPRVDDGRCTGVSMDGVPVDAGTVLLAAGAWSAEVGLGKASHLPIRPLWGAVVSVRLGRPPRHVLEQIGVDEIGAPRKLTETPGEVSATSSVPSLFSLVTAGGTSGVGATVSPDRPDETVVAPLLVERGARFVPELATAPRIGVRVCPRPISGDGRPFIGAVPGIERLFVAAGHGPWGISTGPATGRLVSDVILGRVGGDGIPAGLSAARLTTVPARPEAL